MTHRPLFVAIPTLLSSIALSVALGACGGAAAHPAANAEPEAASAPSASAPAPEEPAPATITTLTLSDAFGNTFFDDDVAGLTKKVAAPTGTGTGLSREWQYEKRALGKSTSCSTLQLVELPNGKSVIYESVLTSPECAKVKLTKKQVDAAHEAATTTDFATVNKQFEKALGKPAIEKKVKTAFWKYQEVDACHLFAVFELVGSGASGSSDGACE